MTKDVITHKKAELRAMQLEWREERTPQERADSAESVAKEFKRLSIAKPGGVVAGFYPVGFEFDCMPLLAVAQDAGAILALPRILPKRVLTFLTWRPGDAMSDGPLGIPYPSGGVEVQPDIVITPLLAFDDEGRRLGYGGGYYDRAIARLRAIKTVITIGVAESWQRQDDLPVEDHDNASRLDYIITERGVMACAAAG